jgi:hypothetical protein
MPSNPSNSTLTFDVPASDDGYTLTLSFDVNVCLTRNQAEGAEDPVDPDDGDDSNPVEPPTDPVPNNIAGAFSNAYKGAVRLHEGNYSSGSIAVDPVNNVIYTDGDSAYGMPVGSGTLPEFLEDQSDPNSLNQVQLQQQAVSILPKIPVTDWGAADTPERAHVWGLTLEDGNLYVNGIIYYGAATYTETTVRIESPEDLENSDVVGCYSCDGAHTVMKWMAPVPQELQTELGGDYLCGASSNAPILERQSSAPSLGILDKSSMASAQAGDVVPVNHLMNFQGRRLHPDTMNYGGATGGDNNDLYVITSNANFGCFIGDYYCTFGYSEAFTPSDSLDFIQQPNPQVESPDYQVVEPGKPCSNPYVGRYREAEQGHIAGFEPGVTEFVPGTWPVEPPGKIVYKDTYGSRVDDIGRVIEGYRCYDSSDRAAYMWVWHKDQLLGADDIGAIEPMYYGEFPAPFFRQNSDVAANSVSGGCLTDEYLYLNFGYVFATDNQFVAPGVVARYSVADIKAALDVL